MRGLRPVGFALVLIAAVFAGCLNQGATEHGARSGPKSLHGTAPPPAVYPGVYKFDGQHSQVLVPGALTGKDPVRQIIKSKDGTDIELGYWLPAVPEGSKVPVILQASPYYGFGGPPIPKLQGNLLMLWDNFLPYGYAVAAVSVRGTGDSGGCMDLMGKKEVADLDDAVNWLGTQPWSNGNVGMIGLSYDGSTPWDVAATGNPHLKTIVPISGLPDIFGLGYRNGSAENRMAGLVSLLYYAESVTATGTGTSAYRSAPHIAEGAVCPESWKGTLVSTTSVVTGERDALGFWAERNRKPLVEKNYHGSILHVQGLQDWNVDPSLTIPWTSKLNQSGVPLKMFLGQWNHAYPDQQGAQSKTSRWDWAEVLLHWFDRWLKDLPIVDTGPAVQVQDDLMQWRDEANWPPRDAQWTTRHLSTGQRLSPEPGAAGAVQLIPNPVAEQVGPMMRSSPAYSADFSTPALEKDMLLSGLPRLHITVRPQGPTGHVAAWLYDVEGNTEKRIGWTTMNLQYYDGGETRKDLTPNVPVLAKIEFQPLDARIPAGHQLKVRVWQYNSEGDRLPAIPPEPIELLYGGTTKSILELPILERGADAYFRPPMPT
jgi:predicted acyl esterase